MKIEDSNSINNKIKITTVASNETLIMMIMMINATILNLVLSFLKPSLTKRERYVSSTTFRDAFYLNLLRLLRVCYDLIIKWFTCFLNWKFNIITSKKPLLRQSLLIIFHLADTQDNSQDTKLLPWFFSQ